MRTTMSGMTVVVHEAIGLRWPSTSTRHCLHAPTGSSSGWSQNRGICTPISSAARITKVPLGTLICSSSMVSDTISTGGVSLVGSASVMHGPLSLGEQTQNCPFQPGQGQFYVCSR